MMGKVIVITAGTYDFFGKGVKQARAVGDVVEADFSAVSALIKAGDMRTATGQEITNAMKSGKAF